MEPQDTPNIDQVINSAMEENNSTLQVTNEVKTEEPTNQEPTSTNVETPTEEESFTTFDPKTAPPELLGVYKQWQRDYTQKRQTEKEYIKGLEEKLSKFEQVGNQPQINPNQPQPKNLVDNIISTVKKEIQTEQENSYIESNEKNFFNLDSRLDPNSPDHDEILLNYVAGKLSDMRDEYEAQNNGSTLGFDFSGNAKSLIAKYEEKLTNANKAFLNQQSQNAKNNAQKFAKTNPTAKTSPSKPSGKMSLDEAFDKAVDDTGANF
jgi:hypothetical protein